MAINILRAREEFSDDEITELLRQDFPKIDSILNEGFSLDDVAGIISEEPELSPEPEPVPEPPAEPVPEPPPIEPPPEPGFAEAPPSTLAVEEPVVEPPVEQIPEGPPPIEPLPEPTVPEASALATAVVPPTEPEPEGEELKALAIGGAKVISDLLEAAGTEGRRAEERKTVGTGQFAAEIRALEASQRKEKTPFKSLSIEEQRAKMEDSPLERAAASVRGFVPNEWRKEVAKLEIGTEKTIIQNARAISTATANTLPRIAVQWGLTAVPVVGIPLALGTNMILEGGGLLETTDAMVDKMKADIIEKKGSLSEQDESMILQFQNRMEELSPTFGILSGTVEFSGNAFGALAKEGKQKLLKKTVKTIANKGKKSKIFRELLGFLGEGLEEVVQGGLQNIFVHKALKDVRKDNKGIELAPEIETGTTFEDFLGGVSGKEFLTGAAVSAVTRGLVKGTRRGRRALPTEEDLPSELDEFIAERQAEEAVPAPTEQPAPEIEVAPTTVEPVEEVPKGPRTLADLTPKQISRIPEDLRKELGLTLPIEVEGELKPVAQEEADIEKEAIESIRIAAKREGLGDEEAQARAETAFKNLDKESAELISKALAAEKRATETDQLTGLKNRNWLQRNDLIKEVKDDRGRSVTIPKDGLQAFLDIDDFGIRNKDFGQAEGDIVLKGFGEALDNELSDIADVVRIGGEEIAVLAKEGVSEKKLVEEIEKVRLKVVETPFKSGKLTFSAGIAQDYEAANDQMVLAKKAGKDQTFIGGKDARGDIAQERVPDTEKEQRGVEKRLREPSAVKAEVTVSRVPQEKLDLLTEKDFTDIGEGRRAKKLKTTKGPDFSVIQKVENEKVTESIVTATKTVGDFEITVEFDATAVGKPTGAGTFSVKPKEGVKAEEFTASRETVFKFDKSDKVFFAGETTIKKHLAETKVEKPAPEKRVLPVGEIVEAPLISQEESIAVPNPEVRKIAKDAGLFGNELKTAISSNKKRREILSGYVNHFGTWMPVTAELVNTVDEQAKKEKVLAEDRIDRFKELGIKNDDSIVTGTDVNQVMNTEDNPATTGKDLFLQLKEGLESLKNISQRYRRQLARRRGSEGVEGIKEKDLSKFSIDEDVLENPNFRDEVRLDIDEDRVGKVKGKLPKKVVAREVALDAVANKDLTGHDSKGKEVQGEVPKEKFGQPPGAPPIVSPPPTPAGPTPPGDPNKIQKAIKQMRADVRRLTRKDRRTILDRFGKGFIATEFPIARRIIGTELGQKAIRSFQLARGANNASKQWVEQALRNINKGLDRREKGLLEDLLYTFRVIEVDQVVKAKPGEKVKITKEDLKKTPFAEGRENPDEVFIERKISNPKGVKPEDAQAFIDKLERTEPETFKKVKAGLDIWWDTMRSQIDLLESEGLIGKQFGDFLRDNHRHYSPRLFVQHVDPSGGIGFVNDPGVVSRPVNVTDSGIKSLKAGDEEGALITDPEFMLLNVIQRVQGRVFKNQANTDLLAYLKKNPDNALGMKLEPKFEVDERGDIVSASVPKGFIRLKAWTDGKAEGFLIPEEFASSWAANDPQASSTFLNFLSMISGTKILKAMATGLNPEFAIANLPRDIAYTLLKQHRAYSPFVPLGLIQISNDLRITAKDAARNGPLTTLYISNGGGMDFLTMQGRISAARVGPKKGTILGKLVPGLSQAEESLDIIQNVMGAAGNFTEKWVRIGLMRRVLDKSLPGKGDVMKRLNSMPEGKKKQDIIERAVWTARTNLDFAQGGSLTKSLDYLFPYLNASVQGTRGLFQAFGSEELIAGKKLEAVKSFGKASLIVAQMMGFAYGTAYYALVDSSESPEDDEETKKIKREKRERLASVPSREKAGNWIFHTPWKFIDKNGNQRFPYLRVAKDQGQRVFTTIAEAMATKTAFAQGYTAEDVDFDQMWMAVQDAFVVVPGQALPPTLDAWLAYSQNRDIWRNDDIWKGQLVIDPKFEKYHDTPKIFTALGEKINASPERMEAALGKVVPHNVWTDMMISIPKGLELLDDKTKQEGDKQIFEVLSGQGGKARGIPGIRKVLRLTFPARLKGARSQRDIANRVIDSGVEFGRVVFEGTPKERFIEFSNKKIFKLVEQAEKDFNNVKVQNNARLAGIMADQRQGLDDVTTKLVENEQEGIEEFREHPSLKAIINLIASPVKDARALKDKAEKQKRPLDKKEISLIQFLGKESKRLKNRFKTQQKIMIENKRLRLSTGSGDLFRLINIEIRRRNKAWQDSLNIIEAASEQEINNGS